MSDIVDLTIDYPYIFLFLVTILEVENRKSNTFEKWVFRNVRRCVHTIR